MPFTRGTGGMQILMFIHPDGQKMMGRVHGGIFGHTETFLDVHGQLTSSVVVILVEQAHKVSDSKEGEDTVVVMIVGGTAKEPN